ncbi:MAG TPA: protein kinase, partial [Streptosporangiaceae bacterium]|nr:protein kinase [Streptosporangiaceae bacterium]
MSEDFPAQLTEFRAGSVLSGYRLEQQVGRGGFAVVFRALDERLGRPVALKILSPALASSSPEFRRRFIAESRAAATVDDPHIIPVYEAGEADGVLFIAMRYVAGGDLRQVLEREGALAPDRAADFVSPVASALDAAHSAGLVHRDVKPGNILVDARAGRPDHVYLSDFGIVKGAALGSLTGVGSSNLGTPDYMAPEQISGQSVDGRTDQYSLACVTVQLLTGTVPFERDSLPALIYAHLSVPPPSLVSLRPDLPAVVDQVVAKAMAKTAEKRYDSCGDFADALRDALGLTPYHRRSSATAPPRSLPPDPAPAGKLDSLRVSTPPGTIEPLPPGTVETPAAAVPAPPGTVETPAAAVPDRTSVDQSASATPASDLRTPTAAAMVIPDQGDETPSPPPTAVSSLPGVSEVLLPTVVESPPAVIGPSDLVPDEQPDGAEPADGRDQPPPAAKTDVRPRAAAETDARPKVGAEIDVRPRTAAETDVRPAAVPADADGVRDLEKTGGLAEPAAEPDRLTDHGPAEDVAPPPERPPDRRSPVIVWVQRHRLPVLALACAILAAAITIPFISSGPSASSGRSATAGPPAASAGFVSLGNLSESPSPVDVYLYSSGDSSPQFVQHGVAYGTILPYRAVNAGEYSVKMRAAGSSASSNPVWSVSLTVKAGGTYTVVPLRASAQQGQLKVIDNNLTTPKGKSFVRVIQAAANQQQVTFHCSCAPGTPGNITTDAAPGTVSPQATIPPGTWTMSATGPSAKTSLPVTLTAGTVHTEIVIDAPGGGIQIINLVDSAGAHQAPTGGASAGSAGTSVSYRRVPVNLPAAWRFVSIASVAFNPSGTTLAIASEQICLWDIAAAHCTRSFGNANITAVAFSPDGKTLAATDNSGHVYLWDVATGSQTATFTDSGSDGAFSVAFSPDGTIVAAGDGNGRTFLWNVATGKAIVTPANPGSKGVNSVAFSPDGKIVAAGDGNGRTFLWNAATGKPIVTLADPGGSGVISVAFSPDDTTMAAGDNNGDTYLWNVATGKVMTTLGELSNVEINSVVFSADGKELATGDQN